MKTLVESIMEGKGGFRWDNEILYRNHATEQKELDRLSGSQKKKFAKTIADDEELDVKFVLQALDALDGEGLWVCTSGFEAYDMDGIKTLAGYWSGETHVYNADDEEWTELNK